MQFFTVFKKYPDDSALIHYGRLLFAPAAPVTGTKYGPVWLVHKCGDAYWACVVTCGTALASMAKDEARKVDGVFLTFECDHWPTYSEAFEALRLHLGLTPEECDPMRMH